MLTYIPFIHMGLCCPAPHSLPNAPTDPKTLETLSNGSKMLLAVPKRTQTFPNYLFAYACSHTIPHHTRPYRIMLTILPYTPQKYRIGLATCFRLASSHDAYVFHARSTSGFCISQLSLEHERSNHWGHSCF